MDKSTDLGSVLTALRMYARRQHASDRAWAQAAGLPPETLSRLQKRMSCDFSTLAALAASAGCEVTIGPKAQPGSPFGREREDELLDLCASGSVDPVAWREHGEGFFMSGLAMMLAGADGFDRQRYMALAETLHPGMSVTEVFDLWLQRSPVSPARFLPLVRHRRQRAA